MHVDVVLLLFSIAGSASTLVNKEMFITSGAPAITDEIHAG